MSIRTLLTVAAAAALSGLAGCASETITTAQVADPQASEQVCSREAPTGSKLVSTQCRSLRQRAEDQQGVNAMSDAVRARSPAAGGRASP